MGFESSYQQHLDAEQRRAVLEALGGSINPDSTLGEVIDAAEALGWSEQMGELSLADLADALLTPEDEDELHAASDEADEVYDEDEDDEDEDDEDEPQLELVAAPKRGRKKAPAKKKSTKKAPAKKKSTKKAPAKKKSAKKASSKKSAGKSKRRSKTTAAEVDERMSLDQAAEFFLPYVEELGEATMQALEEDTGVARRKLRFHIGQLVRNGYLERHGMGRGTYYTLA